MAGLLIVPGLWPVFDSNGDPVAGATINFYQPNTTTPKPVYSDATLSTSLGTSLTTNAAGEPTTLAGAVARLWWAAAGQTFDVQVIAGASTRTWSGVIISEPSSVNSFTASYWGASPTASATVNRNSIQAAIDYVSSLGGGIVDIDVPGYYSIAKRSVAPTDRALNVPKGVNIRGLGTGAPQDSGVALVTLQPSEDMTMFIAGNTMMSQTCTISNASPAVITASAHGKAAGDVVYFATTGTLPAPLIPMFPYYVLPSGLGTNSFQIGLSGSTPAINTTTAGSGVHTLISASSLTHSFGMSDINIYGGGTANVQCLIAESTVGAEWDNVLVEPGNPSAQKHGWLHAANSLAAWLNQYTRLQVGGFTAGVGAAHYGSDSSYSQCLFSGSGVNFRFSEGSITIDGGQCENGNNGGGIGTGRGMELVPSNTGRNVAISIRSRFVANNGDIYIYDSPTGAGFNGRVLIDSTHHDCRATNISIGVNFNNVTIDGTFNEQNPAGTPHITWRGASTGCVVRGNFSEGVTTRFSNLPADALVLSGGNGQLNRAYGMNQVDARWFGAKGDNSNDDYAAIAAALAAHGRVHLAATTANTYRISQPIVLTDNQVLTSDPSVTIFGTGTGGALRLSGSEVVVDIGEIVAPSSAYVVRYFDLDFSRITIRRAGMATTAIFYMDGDAQTENSGLNQWTIGDIQAGSCQYGVYLKNSTAFTHEGELWNILCVFSATVASLRVGASLANNLCRWNRFNLATDAQGITPMLIDVYNDANYFNLFAWQGVTSPPVAHVRFNTGTGANMLDAYPGIQDPIIVLDNGANFWRGRGQAGNESVGGILSTFQRADTGADVYIAENLSSAAVTTKTIGYRMRGRDTVNSGKDVGAFRASPQDANWQNSTVILSGRNADALVGYAFLGINGTPEGQITAPVGAIATRRDGGASTTLYVKQSGTGNTGWVAK